MYRPLSGHRPPTGCPPMNHQTIISAQTAAQQPLLSQLPKIFKPQRASGNGGLTMPWHHTKPSRLPSIHEALSPPCNHDNDQTMETAKALENWAVETTFINDMAIEECVGMSYPSSVASILRHKTIRFPNMCGWRQTSRLYLSQKTCAKWCVYCLHPECLRHLQNKL